MSTARTLIVGIGSPHGDDQAGWLVAERIAAAGGHDRVTVRQTGSPAELLNWLEGIEKLVICDACRGLGRVGELRRWTWPAHELAEATWSGTHDMSLPAVLQLAERLGCLPRHVCIWSVEGIAENPLATMSPEVAAALPRMAEEVAREGEPIEAPTGK